MIFNSLFGTVVYQGTSLHFTERRLDSFAEQLRFSLFDVKRETGIVPAYYFLFAS